MEMTIGNRTIGSSHPVFIVAELSANHMQDFDLAVKTIKAMKDSGADAVKLQTQKPDRITIDCANEYFQIKQGTLWDGRTLYDLYKEVYTPWEWYPALKKLAHELGLILFSTPFDTSAVDFLEDMETPVYKVASFEITDIPLIEYIASTGKPIIMSTGIATVSDIEEALTACRSLGNNQIALLKCTSAYPTPLDEVNLRTIPDMADKFDVVVGLSDHTPGISVPIAAVALGATIIEKHFILDRNIASADAAFSLQPEEFAGMVKAIREVEQASGKINYELSEKMLKSREFARSLFVVEDIKKGDTFTHHNVRSIRPGYGLAPKYIKEIIGKRATQDLKKGTPLKWEYIIS